MTRTEPTPEVGMGVTQGVGSDRYPWTVVWILTPRKIVVQLDRYHRTDHNGLSELQEYEYERDARGTTRTLTLRKNGRWVEEGTAMEHGCWSIGHRQAYQDPSF